MDSPCCDVIGCMLGAEWERASSDNAGIHDYLCTPHHDVLKALNPQAAAAYVPLRRGPDGAGIPRGRAGSPRRGRSSQGCQHELAAAGFHGQ